MPDYSIKLNKNASNKNELIEALKVLGVSNLNRYDNSRYISFSCDESTYNSFVSDNSSSIFAHGPVEFIPIACKDSSSSSKDAFENFKNIRALISGLPDGTDVDVIIIDPDPEIANGDPELPTINYVDWNEFAGLFGTYPVATDTIADLDEDERHNVACASVVCGRQNGWARNVNLYLMQIRWLQTGLADLHPDAIMNWHDSKPINEATGQRNPTIVSCSWSYRSTNRLLGNNWLNIDDGSNNAYWINHIHYRGTDYTFDQSENSLLDWLRNFNVRVSKTSDSSWDGLEDPATIDDFFYTMTSNRAPDDVRIASWTELAEHPGIICIAAAGNDGRRVVPEGDVDFDNHINYSTRREADMVGVGPTISNGERIGEIAYYNRPDYPSAAGFITVGGIGTDAQRKKSVFSTCGPFIDVYAPCEDIVVYGYDNTYTPVNGTSFACPQVAGLLASYLSNVDNRANMDISTSGARTWLYANSLPKMYPEYSVDSQNEISLQSPAANNRVPVYPVGSEVSVITPLTRTTVYPPSHEVNTYSLFFRPGENNRNLLKTTDTGSSSDSLQEMQRFNIFNVNPSNSYFYLHAYDDNLYCFPTPQNRANKQSSSGTFWLDCQQDILQTTIGSSAQIVFGCSVSLGINQQYDVSSCSLLMGQENGDDPNLPYQKKLNTLNSIEIEIQRNESGYTLRYKSMDSVSGPLLVPRVEPAIRRLISINEDYVDELGYVSLFIRYTKRNLVEGEVEILLWNFNTGVHDVVIIEPCDPMSGSNVGMRCSHNAISRADRQTCQPIYPDRPALTVVDFIQFLRS